MPDGLLHFQLVTKCTNNLLPYFLRCVAPLFTARTAERVDEGIWKAIGNYAGFPLGFEHLTAYSDAHVQFRSPIGVGGLGVTPNVVKVTAAFYVGMSGAFKWAATARHRALGAILRAEIGRAHV